MTPFRRPLSAAAAGDAIPFAHEGQIHLFYLSSPSGTTEYPDRVRTTWQHAVTADLQTWEELPPAVVPGAVGSYDGGGIWTGSVVESEGIFHLFYTAHHVAAENPQTICVATSRDLITFDKSDANPLLLPPAGCEPVDWRDPYVFWNDEEATWWMLIAARRATGPLWERGCIMLATSPDLRQWTVEDTPLHDPGDTYCPECPEMWRDAQGRWHLVYSRFSEDVGTVARVATSPRGPFREPSRPELGGRRWYAAKSAPLPSSSNGERAFFGWIHDRATTPAGADRWLWGGDFGLPRIVTPSAEGVLAVRPVLPPWTTDVVTWEGRVGVAGGTRSREVATELPTRAVITAGFDLDEDAPSAVGLDLQTGPDGAGWRVQVSPRDRSVTLRPVPAPLDDFWADLTGRVEAVRDVDGARLSAARLLGDRSDVTVTLVRDDDLIEVFVDDEVAMSHRIPSATRLGAAVRVVDGSSHCRATVTAPDDGGTTG